MPILRNTGKLTGNLLAGIGFGAGIMYFFDPAHGRRRRAAVRDQALHTAKRSAHLLDQASRDTVNRAKGLAWQVREAVGGGPIPDDILEARVRSKIGRVVSHPHAIEVTVREGRVRLHGPILEHEKERLLEAIRSLQGVNEVEDRIEPHKTSENVPSLQGGRPRMMDMPELLQTNWTPAIRVFGALTGAAMMLGPARQRNLLGKLGALAGGALVVRSIANMELRRVTGIGAGRRAVDIQKTLHINAPVEEVYAFWTKYENFPRFMRHVEEVHDLGNGRSHWVAKGPGGTPVSWDAEITEQIPNQLIAWKSSPGSSIGNAGVIRFERMPQADTRVAQGETRITLRMCYNPPGGAIGHAVAWLAGDDLKTMLDEDLVRLKSLIEHGKTRGVGGHEVYYSELRPAQPATGA